MSSSTRITPLELDYKFRTVLRRAFKGKPGSLALIDEIVPSLMEEVPSEAYTEKDLAQHGLILYHQDIDESEAWYLQDEILKAHLSLKKGVPIKILLSSYGGVIVDAFAIVAAIQHAQREGRTIDVHIAGYSMSAGTIISSVCNRRTIDETGWLMVHQAAWATHYQKTPNHEDDVKWTKRLETQILELYSARSGKPLSYYRELWDRRDIYLSAHEALAEGFVDAVLRSPRYSKMERKP